MEYVQQIMTDLASKDAADQKVAKKGIKAVDPNSLTSTEIIRFLSVNGPKTIERLSRDLKMEQTIVEYYVRGLKKKGLVEFSKTDRGSTVVRIK